MEEDLTGIVVPSLQGFAAATPLLFEAALKDKTLTEDDEFLYLAAESFWRAEILFFKQTDADFLREYLRLEPPKARGRMSSIPVVCPSCGRTFGMKATSARTCIYCGKMIPDVAADTDLEETELFAPLESMWESEDSSASPGGGKSGMSKPARALLHLSGVGFLIPFVEHPSMRNAAVTAPDSILSLQRKRRYVSLLRILRTLWTLLRMGGPAAPESLFDAILRQQEEESRKTATNDSSPVGTDESLSFRIAKPMKEPQSEAIRRLLSALIMIAADHGISGRSLDDIFDKLREEKREEGGIPSPRIWICGRCGRENRALGDGRKTCLYCSEPADPIRVEDVFRMPFH